PPRSSRPGPRTVTRGKDAFMHKFSYPQNSIESSIGSRRGCPHSPKARLGGRGGCPRPAWEGDSMFGRRSRRITASVLIAGCLCLLLSTPASAAPSAKAWRSAMAGSGFLGSFWSLLVSLWAGDDGPGGAPPGPPRPYTDEGPGMCPHGGH